MVTEYISLLVLIFVFCYYFAKQVAQTKTIKTEQIILFLYLLAIGFILVAQCLLLGDKMTIITFQNFFNPLVALIFSCILAMVSLLAIPGNALPKQIKTLWRIPIIGFLAGMYFELFYLKYICLANLILAIGISYKRGTELRYLLVKLLPLLVPALMIVIFEINNLIIMNLVLFFILVWGYPILNVVNIHGLILRKKIEVGKI